MTKRQTKKGKARCSAYQALPFFCNACFVGGQHKKLFFSLILIFLAFSAWAEELSLPEITRLDSRDAVFKQYISEVETSRRLLYSSRQNRTEEIVASLTIYSYVPREGEELMAIAARCSIPYGTLASLNRFSHVEDLIPGRTLLLPSVPGIFIPETPASDLERLIFSSREEAAVALSIPREGKIERFLFIPGDDFSPTERVFFLNRGFHFPLRRFQVSSVYGPRVNPVTGRPGIHRGLDLAAPAGSEVYAVRSGRVMDLGEDPVFGKFIIISHENNMVSLYGHLSSISTTVNAEIQSGGLIGRVGSTGQSTGPHLHFELRQNGQSRDPARLLGLFRGTR